MDIEVHMGNIVVTEGPDNLVTSGVGSCLIITLYDPKNQIGALAHTMLPLSPTQSMEHNTKLPYILSNEGMIDQQTFLVTE